MLHAPHAQSRVRYDQTGSSARGLKLGRILSRPAWIARPAGLTLPLKRDEMSGDVLPNLKLVSLLFPTRSGSSTAFQAFSSCRLSLTFWNQFLKSA